jgi:hypothetical protein
MLHVSRQLLLSMYSGPVYQTGTSELIQSSRPPIPIIRKRRMQQQLAQRRQPKQPQKNRNLDTATK